MYGRTYRKGIDQPGKVANPARGQLNRENEYYVCMVITNNNSKSKDQPG